MSFLVLSVDSVGESSRWWCDAPSLFLFDSRTLQHPPPHDILSLTTFILLLWRKRETWVRRCVFLSIFRSFLEDAFISHVDQEYFLGPSRRQERKGKGLRCMSISSLEFILQRKIWSSAFFLMLFSVFFDTIEHFGRIRKESKVKAYRTGRGG